MPGPKVAIVTGASQGLGFVVAKHLRGLGHRVAGVARHDRPLRAVQRALGGPAAFAAVHADVSTASGRARVVRLAERWGRLDVLVNNASFLGPSPLPSLSTLRPPEFRRILEVNLVAPLALTQACLPLLRRSHGLAVNISSDAANAGYPGWGGYGASKAGLDLLTRTWAQELGTSGVGVVSVDPGDMRTAMHQAAFPGQDIGDRPLPDVTLPFWAWLFEQTPASVNGGRFLAQSERWELPR